MLQVVRRGTAVAAALLSLALLTASAAEAAKIALIIGNDAYANLPRLKKAASDARAYADLLKSQGYDQVFLKTDLSKAGMDEAVSTFLDAVGPGDTAVFAYSGHGWSDGAQNYIVGIDAPVTGSQELLTRISLPLRNGVNGVLDDIDRHGAGLKVAIIDACRDNPFKPLANGRSVGVSRGLTLVQPPQGTFVVFSAGTNQTALDELSNSDPDPNSVFTRVFIPLVRSGLSLQEATKQAQQKVVALAKTVQHDQQPAYYDEVLGSAYLGPAGKTPASGNLGTAGVLAPAADPTAADYQAAERVGTAAAWTIFLNNHQADAANFYVQLAKEAQRKLQQQALVTNPPTPPVGATKQVDMSLVVTECDRLAASPIDADRPPGVPGVAPPVLAANSAATIAACQTQVNANPGVRRFQLYLGAAFELAGKYDQARSAYEKAAPAGSVLAMVSLGFLYEKGLGGPVDLSQARTWYEKSALAGNPLGMRNLGVVLRDGLGVPRDSAEARRWFEKAATAGDSGAMNSLGVFYRDGVGVTRDDVEARKWFEKGAAGNDALAMLNLGFAYETGKGGAKDLAQARSWYEKSAAAGNPIAMRDLGVLYRDGLGVTLNYAEARKWFEKGAAGGDIPAMANLGFLYESGRGVTQDFAQARSWYEKAAAGGNGVGQYNLYNLLDTTRGGPRDSNRAVQLLLQSLSKGTDFAFEQLRTNTKNFSPEARTGVQSFLISKGFLRSAANGVFGSDTFAALTAYQKSLPQN